MDKKELIVRRCLHTQCELHVREAGEGEAPSRVIAGYAILFGVPSDPLWSDDDSEAREVIESGAVTKEFLDGQDIKMTMFHNRQLILARSKNGVGTLKYSVDAKGVAFEFEAPNTTDGDKALELVKRGDISGCSFAFDTHYWSSDFVERRSKVVNNYNMIEYHVKAINRIYDFTLALDPAYPETSVEAREFTEELKHEGEQKREPSEEEKQKQERMREQWREMRRAVHESII